MIKKILILLSLIATLTSCDGLLSGLITDGEDGNTSPSYDDISQASSDLTLWLDPDSYVIATQNSETVDFIQYNDNIPVFSDSERTTESFKTNEDLDRLGRVGIALSSMCFDDMPTGEREVLDTKPSGWKQFRYDSSIVPGGWIYARAHLRGYQFMGDQDDEKNLMTGTQSFNINGMLPFENMVADHMREERDHHIMYRATPVFVEDELLARGIIESDCIQCDEGINDDYADFAVFIFNRQPGITINYRTGDSWANEGEAPIDPSTLEDAEDFVYSTESNSYHIPSCYMIERINPENKEEIKAPKEYMEDVLGLKPCGICLDKD